MPTINNGHWVRVQDGEVTHVWDYAPDFARRASEPGWSEAVEVIPESAGPDRDYIAGFTFNTSKTPVEIVHILKTIPFEDRKQSYRDRAEANYRETVRLEESKAQKDDAAIDAAKARRDAVLPRIEACNTHEDLDAVMDAL